MMSLANQLTAPWAVAVKVQQMVRKQETKAMVVPSCDVLTV